VYLLALVLVPPAFFVLPFLFNVTIVCLKKNSDFKENVGFLVKGKWE
jgi:hypothetical protein